MKSAEKKRAKVLPKGPRTVGFSKQVFDMLVQEDLKESPSLQSLPEDVANAYRLRQTSALTEKFCSSATAPADVRWSRTLSKFLEIEEHVKGVNHRLRQDGRTDCQLIAEMRHELAQVLPPVDERLLSRVYKLARPGPGSTAGRTGQENALANKLAHFRTATHRARQHIPGFLQENPAMASMFYGGGTDSGHPCPLPVYADELFSAPKDAEIDRMCGKQADFNGWIQLGIGGVLAYILRRFFGVDVEDQSLGWDRAKQGSVDDSYATIDLSSASDTVSIEVLRRVLPSDWFALLDSVRHSHFRYRGPDMSWTEPCRYEKFSSMGNGFTFPLESLLFAALVRAVSRIHGVVYDYSVYGDDLVVPGSIAGAVVDALGYLGFKVNPKKSFLAGPFRETCGKDFYRGHNIRPWFIRGEPKDEVECYVLHNIIYCHPMGRCFPRVLEYLRSIVPDARVQPPFYGAGEDWQDWDVFLVREYAFGFMVEVAEAPRPVYHRDWQTPVYRLQGFAFCETALPLDDSFNRVALALYSGQSTAKAWRRGRFALRRKTTTAWRSVWG